MSPDASDIFVDDASGSPLATTMPGSCRRATSVMDCGPDEASAGYGRYYPKLISTAVSESDQA